MIPNEFKIGVRCLILLHRQKDGDKLIYMPSVKMISRGQEDWMDCANHLISLQQGHIGYQNHRIYSSVNARSLEKAILHFKHRQVDAEHVGHDQDFYTDIQNRFFSCVARPQSRDQNLFLLDCDTPEQHQYALNFVTITNPELSLDMYYYKTPNGWHIICPPFNPALLTGEHIPTVHKDGMIFIC